MPPASSRCSASPSPVATSRWRRSATLGKSSSTTKRLDTPPHVDGARGGFLAPVWAPCGQRLVDHAPFGHWRTQTFVAALRHDRLDAPWVIDGATNAEMFEIYVETELGPTLRAGDVIILDTLSSHKSPGAAAALRSIDAWFLFLPSYSPDLSPIETAFSKRKGLIRKAAARTYDQLRAAVGHVCDLFSGEECHNYFKAAGYEAD